MSAEITGSANNRNMAGENLRLISGTEKQRKRRNAQAILNGKCGRIQETTPKKMESSRGMNALQRLSWRSNFYEVT
jgi:hypothetical protein